MWYAKILEIWLCKQESQKYDRGRRCVGAMMDRDNLFLLYAVGVSYFLLTKKTDVCRGIVEKLITCKSDNPAMWVERYEWDDFYLQAICTMRTPLTYQDTKMQRANNHNDANGHCCIISHAWWSSWWFTQWYNCHDWHMSLDLVYITFLSHL